MGTRIAQNVGISKTIIVALVGATLAFAINTFDIFSVFYLIAQEFHQDVAILGLISASMTIGIGLLQIPAGTLAARIGPKKVATLGIVIITVFSALIGAASDLYQIVAFRFVMGGGMALFFPSAIILGIQYFRKGSEGLGAGIIVGSNAAGGIIGFAGWAMLAAIIGWRISIMAGSILAAAASLALFLTVPNVPSKPKASVPRIKASQIRALLTDKTLIMIGLVLLGSQIAFEQVLAFMPFYLQESLSIEPAIAGLVASFALMAALAGSPLIGWIYDRIRSFPVLTMLLAGALIIGVSINFFENLPSAVVSSVIVGFVGGGAFTILSNAGRERIVTGQGEYHKSEFANLSVNWVHAIAITGTFWAPILFSTFARQYGYFVAWPVIGMLSFGIMIVASVMIRWSGRSITSGKLGQS